MLPRYRIEINNLSEIDQIIFELFINNWSGSGVVSSLDNMKKQLYKNLQNQIDGYWSGRTAYNIMIRGGFLIDGKSSTKKELTALGKLFMQNYKSSLMDCERRSND